jgi:two-component system sensor histidine kinase/response regulator
MAGLIRKRFQVRAEEQAWLEAEHRVRVRVAAFPPFHMWDHGAQGISVDYMRLICEGYALDCEFITGIPWNQAIRRLRTGDGFDLILTIKRTPERERDIAFTRDYLSLPWVIFSRTDSPPITNLDSLAGRTVSVEKGFVMQELLARGYPGIHLHLVKDSREALSALSQGPVAAYVGNLTVGVYLINKWGYSNVKVAAPTPFGDHTQAMAVRPDWPELAALIDRFLEAMTPAEHAALTNRWLSVRYEKTMDWSLVATYVAAGVVPALLVILVVAYKNRELRREVSQRLEIEHRIRRSEEQLQEAQHLSQIGSWELDLVRGTFTRSDEIGRIFELDPGSSDLGFQTFLNTIHPEDRDAVNAAYSAALKDQKSYSISHRLLMRDGRIKYVHQQCETELGDGSEPLRAIGTVQDITQRKAMELTLVRTKEQAEEASRAKSKFLANMSHELRTPLNSVLGYAQLLQAGNGLSLEQQEDVGEILTAGNHLLELINDVLDLSKVEAGRLELERLEFNLAALVTELGRTFGVQARDKGLALRVEQDRTLPAWRTGDPTRLRQILVNLLGNAIKFTEAGEIRLRTSAAEDDRVMLEVIDTGIGVNDEARAKLFQPFTQGDETMTRRFGGTGLGLAVSRRLVQAMGGEIEVESEPGKGSRFWICLPLEVVTKRSEAPLPEPAGRTTPARYRGRVLVVEDNAVNLEVAVSMLSGFGLVPDTAADGDQALTKLKEARPDLVLMDVQMPVLDGYEATRRLREKEGREGLERTPVVALTANAMAGDRDKALTAGMDGYLAKPVQLKELEKVLTAWLPVEDG